LGPIKVSLTSSNIDRIIDWIVFDWIKLVKKINPFLIIFFSLNLKSIF
jgi:hypothetical protein